MRWLRRVGSGVGGSLEVGAAPAHGALSVCGVRRWEENARRPWPAGAPCPTTPGVQTALCPTLHPDAGNITTTGFNPQESFLAHKTYFPNAAVVLGFEVPPEGSGGNWVSLADVTTNSQFVLANGGAGVMIWSLRPAGTYTPTAQNITTYACQAMGMPNCAAPLPY